MEFSSDGVYAEHSKEVFEKFAKAKDDLTIKMEMENWFPKWKKVALAWISKITISVDQGHTGTSCDKSVAINFSAASSCQLKITVPIIDKEVAKSFTPQREMTERTEYTGLNTNYLTKIDIVGSIGDIGDGSHKQYITWLRVNFFRKYRKLAKLKRVPINLHADIISRLVGAFDNCGGRSIKYLYERDHLAVSKTYLNWMWCDNQHLFPGVRQVAHIGEFPVNARDAKGTWVNSKFKNFVSSKLLAVPHYRSLLVKNLGKYQSAYVIRNWFRSRGKKLLETAQKFSNSLSCEWQAQSLEVSISAPKGFKFLSYLFRISDSPTPEEQDRILDTFISQIINCKHRGSIIVATDFNCPRCRNRTLLAELIGGLTEDDLKKIFRIFIECQQSNKELQKMIDATDTIDHLGNLGCEFPSTVDHLESFDPSHLRGTLTLAPLSLKLAAHAENVDRLRKDVGNYDNNSVSRVPTAVVDIMESYLPV